MSILLILLVYIPQIKMMRSGLVLYMNNINSYFICMSLTPSFAAWISALLRLILCTLCSFPSPGCHTWSERKHSAFTLWTRHRRSRRASPLQVVLLLESCVTLCSVGNDWGGLRCAAHSNEALPFQWK